MSRHNGLNFYKKRKKISKQAVREVFNWFIEIIIAIFLALITVYFFGMMTSVVGVSMEPNLYNGQTVMIDRFSYMFFNPKVGDVIVFVPNGNINSHYYVKRVVAVYGDTVKIEEGDLYVNGEKSDLFSDRILDGGIAENEFTLQSGEFFCMGDNLNSSEDSRSANIGAVKEIDIIGKVWFKLKSEQGNFGFVR